MNLIELYVKDQQVDLSVDTLVRINMKAHELSDLSTVWVNYTNTFRAPFTPNNHAIFGFAHNPLTTSVFPYQASDAKLVQNGIELISSGVVAITLVKDAYELSVFEALDGFYSKLDGKFISDINLPSAVGTFDNTYINSKRNSLTEVCCPVIDYGVTAATPIDIKAPFYLPSFSYKTILEAIMDDAGYTSGRRNFDFFDPAGTFARLALPFGRDKMEYSSKFCKQRSFFAFSSGQTMTFGAGTITNRINFPVQKDGFNDLGWYDGVSQYNQPATPYTMNIKEGAITLNFTVSGLGGGDTLSLKLWFGGSPIIQTFGNGAHSAGPSGFGWASGSTTGNTVWAEFVKAGVGAATVVTITSGEFHGVTDPVPSGITYFPAVLPDIKQTDFMRDFITRYFLSSYEKNGVINFRSFDKIILDEANAIDVTGKRATEIVDQQYFKGLNYSQVNKFSYNDKLLGLGQFTIDNFALDKSHDVIISVFKGTGDTLIDGINVATVAFYNATSVLATDIKLKPGATLVLLRDANANDPTVKYNGVTRTDYQVAYFIDSTYPDSPSMSWNYFISLNATYLVKGLQKLKLIFRYYYLTDADIQQFTFHKPLFDTDSLYLVNSVDDFVPKKPTRIQLLKV